MEKVAFSDPRKKELKEFMNLWNQVTLETEASSLSEKSRNDTARVKEYANAFLPRYCDPNNYELKASIADKKQLWLSHLLNLYQAALFTSQDLLGYKLIMDEKLDK